MKIPIKYNMRSLWVRRVGTAMTALGIGLTVCVAVLMLALVVGLQSTFEESGQQGQFIVIRQGSLNEVNSYFNRDLYPIVRFLPGIVRDPQGEPMVAPELVVVVNWPRLSGDTSNFVMRGTSRVGLELRPELKIVQGRAFRPGLREIIVSRATSERFKDLTLNSSVEMAGNAWTVVGVFDAGSSAYNSEVFAAYEDVAEAWKRPVYSSILLRVESAAAGEQLKKRISDDQRIQLQAVPQTEYFSSQTDAARPIQFLGTFVAILMGIGASFAAMNMMYGSIMSRTSEIATLRALGFRRRNILASFVMESIFLALIGGILGCLMALPAQGITTGTTNLSNSGSFSETLFHFRITPEIMLQGLAFALIVGVLGGLLPAARAARIKLIQALRE